MLMELRARFDEQNNIEWAERLEEAGCTVIYGSEGFKCHSKICQITYRDGMALTRITLLGTGNFNEKTAKLYSDFMLMTAHPGIGEDANAFFRNLALGNLAGDYRFLGVAPAGLKPLIMNGLNREIDRARAGEPARVFFKMNSLTDREVIDKIAEASQAGVDVEMIIRGISCLLPQVPGKTDNVHIRSIVGRFLEHARVYAFGVDADIVYLSSADMMTRNTEHRVEIAYPVLDATCRSMVQEYMRAQLSDNVKARVLSSEGTWQRVERGADEMPFDSQAYLLKHAYAQAEAAAERAAQARRDAAAAQEHDGYEAAQAMLEAVRKAAEAARATAATDAAEVSGADVAPQAAVGVAAVNSAPAEPAAEDQPAVAEAAPDAPAATAVRATIIEPEGRARPPRPPRARTPPSTRSPSGRPVACAPASRSSAWGSRRSSRAPRRSARSTSARRVARIHARKVRYTGRYTQSRKAAHEAHHRTHGLRAGCHRAHARGQDRLRLRGDRGRCRRGAHRVRDPGLRPRPHRAAPRALAGPRRRAVPVRGLLRRLPLGRARPPGAARRQGGEPALVARADRALLRRGHRAPRPAHPLHPRRLGLPQQG